MTEENNINIDRLKQSDTLSQVKGETVSEAFIEAHMYIIKSLASSIIKKRMVPACIEYNDLINWGIEGLIQARQTFKDNQGAQFKTYAYIRIRGTLLDKIRAEWNYRNPSQYSENRQKINNKIKSVVSNYDTTKSQKTESKLVNSVIENTVTAYMISIDPMLVDCESEKLGTQNPEVEYIDKSETVLWEEIDKLNDDEKNIVYLFYVNGLKQLEISEKLNFSRSKVSRLHALALEKLKKRLKRKYNEK